MHWGLSDEQNLYAESLRDWLAGHATAEQVRAWLDESEHREFDDALRHDGWAGVGFDQTIGGEGGGLLELALTARELGRTAAPSGRWLARAIADTVLAGAPAVARASLDAGEITVLATPSDRIPDPGGGPAWRNGTVSGRVPCVFAADSAARFLVPVCTADGAAFALVERDDTAVSVRPRELLDRSRSAGDVLFDAAPGRLILDGMEAGAALRSMAYRAAVLTAADALGAAEAMLAMTVGYAKQRKQFGRPIASFQAVQHAAAQMLVTVESSYSVALFAAASVQDNGPDAGLHAAVAKAQVTANCVELSDLALTVHGAIGYTWEYDLQLFYKRARLNRTLYGAPSAWNEWIAAGLPLLPAS